MILDLFAGAGGWDLGARTLGLDPIGIETDAHACATRAAAGLRTIRTDVTAMGLARLRGRVEGLIASPPCTDYSVAGRRRGLAGQTGALVWEPLRTTLACRPTWCAWEQVPPVLAIWRLCASELRDEGWSAWTGLLDAACWGVPQNRSRAILLAQQYRPVLPPPPTHAKCPHPALDGSPPLLPWVTMAEALGWPEGGQYDSGQNSRVGGGGTARYYRSADRPAGTVTGKTTSQWLVRPVRDDKWWRVSRRRVTRAEISVIQGFPADYPWRGNAHATDQQIGNAIPPPLAAAILRAVAT